MTGEGRKLPGAVATLAAAEAARVVATTGGVFLPSLLSPLFLFSTPSPLFFFIVFSFSPLSLRGRQRRSGGVLWRWRGSTVAAVVVLLLWYFFSSSVTSCSSPLL